MNAWEGVRDTQIDGERAGTRIRQSESDREAARLGAGLDQAKAELRAARRTIMAQENRIKALELHLRLLGEFAGRVAG